MGYWFGAFGTVPQGVRVQTALRLSVLLLLLSCFGICQQPATAPLSSVANIRLVAVVPETVQVSVAADLARFEFSPGSRQARVAIPLGLSWNVNPERARNVELYAFFDLPSRALADARGNVIPAGQLSAGFAQGSLQSFAERQGAGGVRLFGQSVVRDNRRQAINDMLQLQLDLGDASPAAGTYYGVLHLQARVY